MSKWAIVAFVGGAALLGMVALLKAWPVINVVETGKTPEYPDLQPRQYREKTDRVFDAALHAVNRLSRWTLVSSQPERGEIKAEARTLVLRFVDDVMIRVAARGEATIVTVRSASRVGRGDFGQNERNIRAFFEELDRQLQTADQHGTATR